MYVLIDRLILLGICFVILLSSNHDSSAVAAFLTAVTFSAANGLSGSRILLYLSVSIYILLSLASTSFLFFLPLVFYDLFREVHQGKSGPVLLLLGGLGLVLFNLPPAPALLIGLITVTAYVLSSRARSLLECQGRMRRLRDDGWEMTELLREKNKKLLEKQDYGVRMARLNERGRIAREIHDHVGHLLARSILQIGALQVGEERVEARSSLTAVHSTLVEAMDRIRLSVHDLYEESVDFRVQIEKLVQGFSFCPIRLDYKLGADPGRDIQQCFLAVIKEGLHNVVRHSNATRVTVALVEHPALYQLVLQDNGTKCAAAAQQGLGLLSMNDRVQALAGRLAIEREGGFRLFISIPKGGRLDESINN